MTLTEISAELTFFIAGIQKNMAFFWIIFCSLWLFNIFNWLIGSKLNILGLRPRKKFGLIGIVTGTFLHKDFNHLFFNSIPLIALGLFMLSFGIAIFVIASLIIILLEGIILWCFGRNAIHIGASGLISGYFSFLLIAAYYRPNISSIFIAIITLYYFGSILLGLLPSEEKVSWEAHLFGFLAGIIAFLSLANIRI